MKSRADEPGKADEAVARILDQMQLEDPPEDLKENVLRAIGSRPEPARSGWLETLRAGVQGALFARLYPVAVGAAAGVIVVALASGSGAWKGGRGASVDGAMAPFGAAGAAKVDDQRFELGRANVRFEVFRSGGRATIKVSADAADPVVVTIQLPPGTARVERLLSVPAASGGVEYGAGWVRIRQSGRDLAEVGLALESGAGDAPIPIVIASQAGTIQGSLRASPGPAASAPAGAPH